MKLYGKDWKRVEKFIGTRSGAQIRSHAQKFFIMVERTQGLDIDEYIRQLQSKKREVKTLDKDDTQERQRRLSTNSEEVSAEINDRAKQATLDQEKLSKFMDVLKY